MCPEKATKDFNVVYDKINKWSIPQNLISSTVILLISAVPLNNLDVAISKKSLVFKCVVQSCGTESLC